MDLDIMILTKLLISAFGLFLSNCLLIELATNAFSGGIGSQVTTGAYVESPTRAVNTNIMDMEAVNTATRRNMRSVVDHKRLTETVPI
jgi:hypothetical protein